MFSFSQLEYIVALDTHGNFKIASEHCYITQPTLSMQIKKMEEELGVVLFDRSKQPVIPTDIGKDVIAQARIILTERDKVQEIVDVHQDQIQGDLHLGVIPSVAPYLVPLFIVEMNKKHPNLFIHVHDMLTEELIGALRKEVIDVAILVTPIESKQILTRALYYEEIALYVSSDHSFYTMDKISLEQLNRNEMWMLREGHCFRNQSLNLCGAAEAEQGERRFAFETGSIETLMKMVDLQGGYTLIPEMVISNIPPEKRGGIKWLGGNSPHREVSIAVYRNLSKRRRIQALENTIKSSIPSSMLELSNGEIVHWI